MVDEVTTGSAQLVDVRSQGEWESGHAEHALHIPMSALMGGETSALHTDKKIYIYCASGMRSEQAATYLRAQGFDAENVGGLREWLNAGGTLVV